MAVYFILRGESVSEIEKQWYVDKLERLKIEYDKTDDKFSKRKIDILQQIQIVEEILKKNKGECES